jgi:periplasmic protein TonB
MKLPLPEDPKQRALVVAVLCSVLLHILLLGSIIWGNRFAPALFAKRGETLFVDITPEKPEEKAPLGDPERPGGPASPPPPPKTPAPPAPRPKIADAPAPPARKAPAARPAPEPPKQVAKAAPPPAEPSAKASAPPAPEAGPAAPPSQQAAPREPPPAPAPQPQTADASTSQGPSPAPTPPSPPGRSGTQTALAKPPPGPSASIFRQPGGGGGLHGGRGGVAGEPVPLDTDDPNYREYMQRVKQRIYDNWGYPYEAQTRGMQGKLVVEFHISKDGHLQFIELKQTSGEEILDRFAMNAVKLAQVYDPLPDNMKRDVLPIVAVFVYALRGPLSVLQFLR